MRVLYWTRLFWPHIGGVEVLGAKLLPALSQRNCEAIVVTSQDRPDLHEVDLYRNIPIYRFPFWTAVTNSATNQLIEVKRRIAALTRTFAPDLVHMNNIDHSAFFYLQTTDAYPAPLLLTVHGAVDHRGLGHDTLVGQILRRADWVTCVSGAVLNYLRQLHPEITPHSSLIYNGLEAPPLPSGPAPSDAARVLCLGRFTKEKGFDLALAAFASVPDRSPAARLVMAGDGPERPNLEQQATDMGITDRVQFLGWVSPDKVTPLIRTATVVVVPSRHEGFSLVALEAALMGRPVVATRVGGLPEVVVHQETGLLVEPEDTKGLAEAIAFLLAHPDAATQMGRAARRRAIDVFGWERCVDSYDMLYRKLVKGAAYVDAAESPASQ